MTETFFESPAEREEREATEAGQFPLANPPFADVLAEIEWWNEEARRVQPGDYDYGR